MSEVQRNPSGEGNSDHRRPDPFPGWRVRESKQLVPSSVTEDRGYPYLDRVSVFSMMLAQAKKGGFTDSQTILIKKCLRSSLLGVKDFCPEYIERVSETLWGYDIESEDFISDSVDH